MVFAATVPEDVDLVFHDDNVSEIPFDEPVDPGRHLYDVDLSVAAGL